MRKLFAPFTFAGRMLLWAFAWPLGLWRSLRHGRKKDMARLERTLRKRGVIR